GPRNFPRRRSRPQARPAPSLSSTKTPHNLPPEPPAASRPRPQCILDIAALAAAATRTTAKRSTTPGPTRISGTTRHHACASESAHGRTPNATGPRSLFESSKLATQSSGAPDRNSGAPVGDLKPASEAAGADQPYRKTAALRSTAPASH